MDAPSRPPPAGRARSAARTSRAPANRSRKAGSDSIALAQAAVAGSRSARVCRPGRRHETHVGRDRREAARRRCSGRARMCISPKRAWCLRLLRSTRRSPSAAAPAGGGRAPARRRSSNRRPSAAMVTRAAMRLLAGRARSTATPLTMPPSDRRALADRDARLEHGAGARLPVEQRRSRGRARLTERPCMPAGIARLHARPSAAFARHDHAVDRKPAARQPAGETEPPQHGERAGIERVAAQLVARKRAAIDEAHARAGPREHRRGHAPAGPAPTIRTSGVTIMSPAVYD